MEATMRLFRSLRAKGLLKELGRSETSLYWSSLRLVISSLRIQNPTPGLQCPRQPCGYWARQTTQPEYAQIVETYITVPTSNPFSRARQLMEGPVTGYRDTEFLHACRDLARSGEIAEAEKRGSSGNCCNSQPCHPSYRRSECRSTTSTLRVPVILDHYVQ